MDRKIKQLKKKPDKYQQIELGKILELLAGRIRLKEGRTNV